MSLFSTAKSPVNRNRPVPFWSWNDRLTPEECCRQIEQMHDAGIGGFFMHARGGLRTGYLSDEWFDVTKACVQKAKQLGMNAWAYDENGWPSGFGGGIVNGKGLFYQQKYLRSKFLYGKEKPQETPHLLALYDAFGKPLPKESEILPAEGYLVLYYDVNPYYVDTLDGRVIAEFLASTHEQYFAHLTSDERKTMRGFFTDEPQISRDGIPWSFVLEEEYRKRYHDELLPHLPQLFYAWGKDYRQTRYRFWKLVGELFSQNFMKQIHDWCAAHDWELTGHLVLEEGLIMQLTSNGTCMPHYEYFDIPGMDILGRNLTWVTLPLQLFSAAAQTGKKQILSETFALCGWAVSFADLQWLVQWQFVHGVNLICQHLEGYSLRGIRKRDYPASLFRHQPWWNYYKPFNDYLSRMGTLLEAGEVKYEVLLLHPEASAHLCFNNADNGAARLYDRDFYAATNALEAAQINHHYGDEIMMERHGSVQDGALRIGEQSYRLVILPKMANLSSKQVELLTDFVAQGGKLLGWRNDLEPVSFAVDGTVGTPCPILDKVEWFDSMDQLVDAIPPRFRPVRVHLENGDAAKSINWTQRAFPDFDGKPAVLHYFVNNERFSATETTICVPGKGIEGYDTHTGETYPLRYTSDGECCLLAQRFAPAGDFALLSRDYEVAPAAEKAIPGKALALGENWSLAACTDNLLTLDHCRCTVDGEELFSREYVLTINDALLARERQNQSIALEFDFEIADGYDFKQPLDLLVEHPERQKIFVNDKEISNLPHGIFADPAFERIAIGNAVQPGRNLIRLESNYHQDESVFECLRAAKVFESERNKLSLDSEVEAIYLAGPFGVKTDGNCFTHLTEDSSRYNGAFALAARPATVKGDRLEESGLPFFAGNATISQTVTLTAEEASEPHALAFDAFYGSVLICSVNGKEIATITRPDYRAEIPAGLLHEGANEIALQFVTSLRNMLGPFHLAAGDSHGVCPFHFYKTPGGPFTPYGAQPWNDGFCFVRHGVMPSK